MAPWHAQLLGGWGLMGPPGVPWLPAGPLLHGDNGAGWGAAGLLLYHRCYGAAQCLWEGVENEAQRGAGMQMGLYGLPRGTRTGGAGWLSPTQHPPAMGSDQLLPSPLQQKPGTWEGSLQVPVELGQEQLLHCGVLHIQRSGETHGEEELGCTGIARGAGAGWWQLRGGADGAIRALC